MREGLAESNAVGRAGGYRDDLWTEVLQLGTVIARGLEFFEPGPRPVPLLSVPVPPNFTRRHLESSWTGRSYRCDWPGGSVTVHLRTTLPGPLFAEFGRQLNLRFAFGNAPHELEGLETHQLWSRDSRGGLGRVLLLTGPRRPTLLVASRPISEVQIVTHEHISLSFDDDKACVMWVPLLPGAQELLSQESLELWVRLVTAPPLCCQELFQIDGNLVRIRQHFSDLHGTSSLLAPIPPMAALLADRGNLQRLPPAHVLTKTLIGPHAVIQGNALDWTIDASWMAARLTELRPISGKLADGLGPIPDELVYAGDVSWQPGTPMDQCLALRVWAPLAEVMPTHLWQQLKPQLHPPTPQQFRQSLHVVTEPFTHRRWAKDTSIFAERFEVSYDADWYNGLTLAGLWRGACCADQEIAQACQRLAHDLRPERELLFNYMWLFHDWGLCCSWTDPRGETWNLDCSHNGLEGVLAEARLRQTEHDQPGADQAMYLAARMSVAFMAAFELADWVRDVGFVLHDGGDPHLGIDAMREWRGTSICGPANKRAYALPAHFFEYFHLLAKHGPVDRLAAVADIWQRHYPQRYQNWDRFYTGGKRSAQQSLHQEERVQAAVMYHLAPEVGLRLWVLGQPGASVEAMFKTPLNLAEQLWCRSGAAIAPQPSAE